MSGFFLLPPTQPFYLIFHLKRYNLLKSTVMKSLLKLTLILGIVFFSSGCNKNDKEIQNQETGNIQILQFSHSDCLNSTFKDELVESIELQAINQNQLQITHKNSMFNCCPGILSVICAVNNNTIIINEDESEYGCHCICPYDFNLTIGSLSTSNYLIKIQKMGEDYFQFEINFHQNFESTIVID